MLAEDCEETCEEAHVVPKQKERGERRKEEPKKKTGSQWPYNPICLSLQLNSKERGGEKECEDPGGEGAMEENN